MFRVPVITDNNTKVNKDIRRFYGTPALQSAGKEVQKKANAEASGSDTDAEKKDAATPMQDAEGLQSSLRQTKSHRLADMFVFASLFGAVVIRFSRLRK
jgi:hypothetical protein